MTINSLNKRDRIALITALIALILIATTAFVLAVKNNSKADFIDSSKKQWKLQSSGYAATKTAEEVLYHDAGANAQTKSAFFLSGSMPEYIDPYGFHFYPQYLQIWALTSSTGVVSGHMRIIDSITDNNNAGISADITSYEGLESSANRTFKGAIDATRVLTCVVPPYPRKGLASPLYYNTFASTPLEVNCTISSPTYISRLLLDRSTVRYREFVAPLITPTTGPTAAPISTTGPTSLPISPATATPSPYSSASPTPTPTPAPVTFNMDNFKVTLSQARIAKDRITIGSIVDAKNAVTTFFAGSYPFRSTNPTLDSDANKLLTDTNKQVEGQDNQTIINESKTMIADLQGLSPYKTVSSDFSKFAIDKLVFPEMRVDYSQLAFYNSRHAHDNFFPELSDWQVLTSDLAQLTKDSQQVGGPVYTADIAKLNTDFAAIKVNPNNPGQVQLNRDQAKSLFDDINKIYIDCDIQ